MDEVQARIDSGKARVYTAAEFKELVRAGNRPGLDGVDVVTCGTLGVMSGTMAVFNIPAAAPGAFSRADSITLNGVPGSVGPCPNESLGLVDCIVNGTARRDASYGGGHLFRDLVAGKPVHVVVHADGKVFERDVTLREIPFARMILTRGAFRNYTCFANGSDSDYHTIFSGPLPMRGGMSEASVSGGGEINPIQNDPGLDYLRPGAMVLLNGAPGMVLGTGTRSSAEKPNLSIQADMHLMRADYMGGFRTSEGPECLTSVAAAMPVTDAASLDRVSILDEDVPLPLADVRDRKAVAEGRYSEVWRGTDRDISVDLGECLHCPECGADANCPVGARPSEGIDASLCIQCGMCVGTCVGHVFSADLGKVRFWSGDVPITVRQSSRAIAERICEDLKDRVSAGDWKLRC
ncbi:MAG: methanogenesis marker 16 metalloprotein [Thermoplasmata archaeon]|nr:methanogenesis marker 16 metalloprotein [Thermoplasmata archaeon]